MTCMQWAVCVFMLTLTSSHSAPWNTTRLSHSRHLDGARSFLSLCVCAALDICVFRKGPGELAASVTISLKPKRQCLQSLFLFCSFRPFQKILKNVSSNNYSALLTCLDYILYMSVCYSITKKNRIVQCQTAREHVWKCYSMYKSLPLSEGDGGSLSSRSSAEDMVPVDGVLGSLLLKSPGKWHKWIISFNTFCLQSIQNHIQMMHYYSKV